MAEGQKIQYAAFEVLSEGRAASHHVDGIVDGLRDQGWTVHLAAFRRRTPLAVRLVVVTVWALNGSRAVPLYVRHHPADFLLILAARLIGRPVVLEINGPPSDVVGARPWLRPVVVLLLWLDSVTLRSAAGFVCATPGLAEWIRSRCKRARGGCAPIAVVPAGVNPDLFSQRSGPSEGGFALYVGSLVSWQGVDVMLQALKQPQWPSGVDLVVAGDGPLAGKLREADDPRLRYLGQLSPEAVRRLVHDAMCALSPKTYQTDAGRVTGLFPVKVLEYMAGGCPVIVSRVPEQDRIVEEAAAGLIIQPDDPVGLALAVLELAQMSTAELMQLGSNGRSAVVAKHRWEDRVVSTIELIESAVGGARRR